MTVLNLVVSPSERIVIILLGGSQGAGIGAIWDWSELRKQRYGYDNVEGSEFSSEPKDCS